MSATCRSCGAEIFWAFTEAGKKMPIDAKPVPGGVFFVTRRADGEYVCHAKDAPGFVRYSSHFATCPDAQKHRRRK